MNDHGNKFTLPALISIINLIRKKEIEIQKEIEFTSENSIYKININKERKTYINEEYKISLIEIKDHDNLYTNSFLNLKKKIILFLKRSKMKQ